MKANQQLAMFGGPGYVGEKHGILTIIDDSMAVDKPIHDQAVYCRCDCGKFKTAKYRDLTRGRTQSCGCLAEKIRKINIKSAQVASIKKYEGERFGNLVAVKIVGRSKNENLWECACDCGNKRYVITSNLTLGRVKSCGKCGLAKRPKPPKPPKPEKIKRKPIDREQFAKDAHCVFVDMGKPHLDEVAQEVGYVSGQSVGVLLTAFVPKYKEDSKERRSKSKSSKCETKRKLKSKMFKYEKDFAKYISETILTGIPNRLGVNDMSIMEIDCLAMDSVLIEFKTTCRKVDIARAIGQCVINKISFKGVATKAIVCVPDDVRCKWSSIKDGCASHGVTLCKASELRAVVDALL